jgi:hypothetical protein
MFLVLRLSSGFALVALLVPLLGAALSASAQISSVSEPLSGAIGDTSSIYTESSTSGTLGSLAPGANNLTNAYNRDGINDPFRFQIESGAMSPYVSGGVNDYAEFAAMSGTLNDPLVALQFSDYRNNSRQMSGVLSSGQGRGYSALSMNTTQTFSHARPLESMAAFGASANDSVAGSTQGIDASAATGRDAAALDPQAAPAYGTPVTAEGVIPEAGGTTGENTSTPRASGDSSGTGPSISADTSVMLGGSADQMPMGMGPGSSFPILAIISPSPARFPDSTMGTAGQPMQVEGPASSPLLSTRGAEGGSPFADINSETASFVHTGGPQAKAGLARPAERQSSEAVYEKGRRAEMRRMINNPGASPPSAFERQRSYRTYLDRPSSGETATHKAPSVVATPH